MKKIIIALFAMAIVSSASAAPAGPGRGGFHGGGRPVVIVHGGFGYYNPYFSPFGYYGFGYPFGYPYAVGAYPPSKLDMQVQEIKNDYADKIQSVRMDKTLSGKERREKVRAFKAARDHDVREAKVNYYKS
ncbi:hypothetical protein GA0116948_104202 [Chitinophaga costaii]|uniref:Heavy-metal resistance n=1 Tax=Chitinophaga costaii TaxID=1335309 RepID=A0A1C4CMI8_9BACT|nr:hypothetical protein [Chitinophaga costaii]SCC20299.1 hypothetical protein GA0116948_104202 [Chitinophaga costaii]